jgi:hypothetical protein
MLFSASSVWANRATFGCTLSSNHPAYLLFWVLCPVYGHQGMATAMRASSHRRRFATDKPDGFFPPALTTAIGHCLPAIGLGMRYLVLH